MKRTFLVLHALAGALVITCGAAADDKAGPRDSVSIERTHSPAARFAALELDPADLLAAHESGETPSCIVHRAGPRDSVIVKRRC